MPFPYQLKADYATAKEQKGRNMQAATPLARPNQKRLSSHERHDIFAKLLRTTKHDQAAHLKDFSALFHNLSHFL